MHISLVFEGIRYNAHVEHNVNIMIIRWQKDMWVSATLTIGVSLYLMKINRIVITRVNPTIVKVIVLYNSIPVRTKY